MEKRIDLVHLQITRNCNLRCHFCGQWGKKGFFADKQGEDMSYSDWKKVISELEELNPRPEVILWGGEPLVSLYFLDIVRLLKTKGFKLGMVTNGVFIDKYTDLIKESFDMVYVSIDGDKNLHDSIRGRGVFEKVYKNLKLLDCKKVTIMTVLTKELDIVSFSKLFSAYKILLHEMIPFQQQEVFKTNINLPSNVIYMHHGDKAKMEYCKSPWSHIHITWNGDMMFCTDYYDFSVGNVKEHTIKELFENEKSEAFRTAVRLGKNKNCSHCSWKNNSEFKI